MNIELKDVTLGPVYLQVRQQIETQISGKQVTSGEALPSPGTLAQKLSVDRGEIQRAYFELERSGLIKKETDKEYMTYSGWKGGEKYRSVAHVRAKHPEELIHRAVRGMIPKNRLGRRLLTKLKVYKGAQHPHGAQNPATLTVAS